MPPSQQAMHLPKFRIIIQPKIAQQMFIHPTTEVIRNYAHLQQLQLIFMIRTSNLLLLIPPCQEIRQQGVIQLHQCDYQLHYLTTQQLDYNHLGENGQATVLP